MPTRARSHIIGFRRGGSDWQRNDTLSLANWAKASGFAAIDLNQGTGQDIAEVTSAGLALGSVDLLQFADITHPDAGIRREVISSNVAYVNQAAAWGAKIFFSIVGADPAKTRGENYRIAVESFSPIAEAATSAGATIAIEGYPGHAPHYALLCTTPETCRAFLKDLPRGVAINYDPSHLIRLGVDHIRFLKEFLPHVIHVHAKDTLLLSEALYEFGVHQPSAFQPAHRYGGHTWRYCIPGRGDARWGEIFTVLDTCDYSGIVSVELEDEDFNGSEDGEKRGLLQSLSFLRGVV